MNVELNTTEINYILSISRFHNKRVTLYYVGDFPISNHTVNRLVTDGWLERAAEDTSVSSRYPKAHIYCLSKKAEALVTLYTI